MKKLIILAIVIAMTQSTEAQNKVVVIANGIEERKGSLLIAVYNSESSYMKKPYKVSSTKITDTTVETVFDLPNGDYSFSMFQDANNNMQMDTGYFGIPTEKYGFSNNAAGKMGPPTFKETEVFIDKNISININMK